MTPIDQSSPSKIVLSRLIAQAKFEPNIDNDDEEKYSDDEIVDQIKMHKFKERIRRTDLVTETVAVQDIIVGVEKAKN